LPASSEGWRKEVKEKSSDPHSSAVTIQWISTVSRYRRMITYKQLGRVSKQDPPRQIRNNMHAKFWPRMGGYTFLTVLSFHSISPSELAWNSVGTWLRTWDV
jgi:hypothetical protein